MKKVEESMETASKDVEKHTLRIKKSE